MADKSLLGSYSDPTGTYTFTGLGLVPIGTILAIGDAGAWALPANGAIKDGYALCNGQEKPAGSAAGLAANLPNLTDDRFLHGSTAIGGTGGSTSKTTTGIAASFDKNVMNTNQNAHFHKLPFWGYTNESGTFGQLNFTMNTNQNGRGYYGETNVGGSAGAIASTSSVIITPANVTNVNSSSESITWNSATVTTTITQGTIADIRPNYFNVVYVMRVA